MLEKCILKLYRERKYDIEESSLEGKYKDWQKKLHPDLVHSKSEVFLNVLLGFGNNRCLNLYPETG